MTIRAFESASNNSVHFYSEPSLTTNASPNAISTRYSEELLRPDRKIFKSLFTPKTPVAKLNLRDRTAITFSTDLVRTPDTQTLFDYGGGSIDNETTLVRKNLLTFSEQFNNAAWNVRWGGAGTVTANAVTAPDGTLTGDSFTATLGGSGFGQAVSVTAGTTYTFSAWIRTAGGTTIAARTTADGSNGINPIGLGVPISSTAWIRSSITWTETITGTRYVGAFCNPSSSFDIWGAQLEVGRLVSAYQTVGATYTPLPHLITTQDPGAHRRNLLRNTELFSDASWVGYFAKPTLTSGQLAPDGSLTAWSWNAAATTGGPGSVFGGLLFEAPASAVGRIVTASIWLRASSPITFWFAIADGVGGQINVTTSWQRFTVTGAVPVINPRFIQFYDDTNPSTTIFFWRPQSEYGSVATDYERVDSDFFPMETAVTSVPVPSVAPRINILTSTEALDNSGVWIRNNNPTITVNAAVAPNGTLTAEKIDTSQGGNGVFAIGSVTSLVPHTFSVYIKDFSANSVLRIGPDARPPNGFIQLNANTGQITTTAANVISSSVVPAANGWYRASVTTTPTSLVTGPAYVVYAAGSGASSFLAWGAQLEVGNVATSYQRVDSALVLSENVADAGNTNPTITTQDPGAHRRNLLLNTEVGSAWNNSQFVTVAEQGLINTVRGRTTFVRATANGTADPFAGRNGTTGRIAGRTFTWSVVLWTDSGQPTTTGGLFMYGATGTEQVKFTNVTITTVPTLYTLTGTFTSAAVSTALTCRVDLLDNAVNGNYLYITAPQLEEGPIATEYERIDASFFPQELAVTTSNVTVVAPRRNILNYTQNFNTPGWSTQGGTTLTNNTALAPDGTLSADTAQSGTGQTSSGFSQSVTLPIVPHTASIWLRAGNTSNGHFGVYNLTNLAWNNATPFMISGPGTITGSALMFVSGLSANQWSRVGITFAPTVASNAFYFYPETTGVSTSKTVQVWGAQLETGNVATSYQHVDVTTLALADNRPDAGNTNPTITTQDPGAHRRNILINTEVLTGSGWTPQNVTVSQISGATWKITPTASTGLHYLVTSAVTTGINTLTWEMKAAELTAVYFEMYNNLGVAGIAGINLTTGAVLTTNGGVTAVVTPLSDGWYRISLTRDLLSGTSPIFFTVYPNAYGSYTANGTDGILARRPQLERGSVATEYERIDAAFFPTETAVTSAQASANLDYSTGSVRSMFYSTGNTVASAVSARAENRERLVVQSTNDKLDMYIINSGQVIERKTNTIAISNTTSIVIGTSNAGIRVFANGIETLNNTAPIAFFYNQAGNTSVKSQYLPTGSIDSLERKLTFSSGLNGNASAVTLYYTGD